mgnify:FL=1
MTSAVLVCAGKGERANFGFNKLLKEVDGVPVFEKTLYAFYAHPAIDEIIVVCAGKDEATFSAIAEKLGAEVKFVRGGKDRSASVENGVNEAKGEIVVVHDGARPFVSAKIITDCVNSAIGFGSGVACVPATDTTAKIAYDGEDKYIVSAARDNIYKVQTPQAFNKKLLLKAFSLKTGDEVFTDESGLFAKYIGRCRAVNGNERNRKLTTAEDFVPGENLRAGVGFDLHRLVEGRKLVLGGIEIPNDKGLLGHSDADVLLHAVSDALLSSASLGDIGKYFPDTDEKYKGVSSVILFDKVKEMLEENGYKIVNVSAVIMAQKPKLSPFVKAMTENLASLCGVTPDRVGITCTTLEGIGTVGREEGIAVSAYCLTEKITR